jgi:hypothetical protein
VIALGDRMDERLEKALEFSNYTVTLNTQIRLLEEKFNENIIYYYNGGQFTALEGRITFCLAMLGAGHEEIVLLDDNKTPIQVTDLEEFTDELTDRYFSATNEYQTGYNEIRKNRSIKGIIEL